MAKLKLTNEPKIEYYQGDTASHVFEFLDADFFNAITSVKVICESLEICQECTRVEEEQSYKFLLDADVTALHTAGSYLYSIVVEFSTDYRLTAESLNYNVYERKNNGSCLVIE